MSHFVVLLVIDPDAYAVPEKEEDLERLVDRLLAYYREDLLVPRYVRECFCLGIVAHREIVRQVEHEIPLGPIRDAYFTEHRDVDDFSIRGRRLWDEATAERNALMNALRSEYSDGELRAPDPSCSTCNGSGKYATYRNPNAKWDYVSVGGRWSDWLPRTVLPVPEVPHFVAMTEEMEEEGSSPQRPDYPYAIVTPDLAWHARAEMGWFGMSGNNRDAAEWHAEVDEIMLGLDPDAVAVVVDCHI